MKCFAKWPSQRIRWGMHDCQNIIAFVCGYFWLHPSYVHAQVTFNLQRKSCIRTSYKLMISWRKILKYKCTLSKWALNPFMPPLPKWEASTTLSYFRTQTHRIHDTNDLVYSIEETKPTKVIINWVDIPLGMGCTFKHTPLRKCAQVALSIDNYGCLTPFPSFAILLL